MYRFIVPCQITVQRGSKPQYLIHNKLLLKHSPILDTALACFMPVTAICSCKTYIKNKYCKRHKEVFKAILFVYLYLVF